jgi:hypothetical protein
MSGKCVVRNKKFFVPNFGHEFSLWIVCMRLITMVIMGHKNKEVQIYIVQSLRHKINFLSWSWDTIGLEC